MGSLSSQVGSFFENLPWRRELGTSEGDQTMSSSFPAAHPAATEALKHSLPRWIPGATSFERVVAFLAKYQPRETAARP